MSNTEVDEYARPFGEQVAPHPTGQLLGNYFPDKGLNVEAKARGRVLNLLDAPIQGISALRNILLENKKRLLQVSAISIGVLGGVTAGAVILREQRKPQV